MFDRLPTPYGLVRFGVAPDHPKIKSVIRVYEKTAARPEFRFFGNVEVGRDVSVEELARALPRDRLRLRHARPTASSASRARSWPEAIPPPSSSTGTTPTPISPTASSTSPVSASS